MELRPSVIFVAEKDFWKEDSSLRALRFYEDMLRAAFSRFFNTSVRSHA